MGAHSKNTGQKYLPVGINAESWTENMGISHEYHSAPRRRTRGGIGGKLRLAGVIVAILLVAYAVTAILEKGTVEEDSTPQTGAGGIAQNILAPLPMQGEADSSSAAQDGSIGEQPIAAARRRRYSWKASALPGRPTVLIPLRRMMPVLSGSRPAVR